MKQGTLINNKPRGTPMELNELKELNQSSNRAAYSSEHVVSGIPIPKAKRIELFSPEEWEEFTEEYALSRKSQYTKIGRYAGAGDKGLDVVGFLNGTTFESGWDNYQCKFYRNSLIPSDIWVEFGKIIYFSFVGDFTVPRKYYFVAPKGIGTTLANYLAKPDVLKVKIKEAWESKISDRISSTFKAELTGKLQAYFEQFDFAIFDSISLADMIIEHSNTPFHSVRFGGGLAVRPESELPPGEITTGESVFTRQLLLAYGDCEGEIPEDSTWLDDKTKYKRNFKRQRERFYQAESLRNFSRDNVPAGTFERLQDDIYQGVVDVSDAEHANGFIKMTDTVNQAAQISIDSSPLKSVIKVADKQGICHQLVNDNLLRWVEDE